ncbi:hypothetical protein BD309DRAFT_172264 [Dichomitus squalens]|nr:hypothetical protein BD309DRAFT_172264 [Dichomitus squalens]
MVAAVQMLSEKWLSMSRHPAASGHCRPHLADLVRVYHLLLIPCPIWSELRNLVITDHPFRFFADVGIHRRDSTRRRWPRTSSSSLPPLLCMEGRYPLQKRYS